MRLNIIKWLKEEILHRVSDNTRMGNFELTSVDQPIEELVRLRHECKQVVDYRLQIGVRVEADPDALQGARERVFRMFCRELYKDLIEELHQLEEWAFKEGYDENIQKRINRIRKLCYGEDVQDL